jgi:glutathione S-transferase
MMRLYDYGPSANCLKARVLLVQLGIDYERVPVDLFTGETQAPDYLARNPAGRTPVLELESGECIPESNAILLYLAEGTPFLPCDPVAKARVHGWLFFEQNLLEPNVGSARFWKMTGRAAQRPETFAQKVEAGRAALEALERGLEGRAFLVGDGYTVADLSLYAYTHVAADAGMDMDRFPLIRAWLRRVESQPSFVNDLEPYPSNAYAGAGEPSVHDRKPAR